MAMSMPRVGLLVLMLSSLGCQLDAGISNTGFCMHARLLNLRISEGYCEAGETYIGQSSEAASKQFMKATEEVLPDLVEAGIRAAMSCVSGGASEAVPTLLQSCDILGAIKPEEEPSGDEALVDPEAMEPKPEKRRRTPEEKAANRARREGSTR